MFKKVKTFFENLYIDEHYQVKLQWTWEDRLLWKDAAKRVKFINECKDINKLDHRQNTLLNCIIGKSQNLLDSVLNKNPDVNQPSPDGLTSIIYLMNSDQLYQKDKVERLSKLLSRGANINAVDLHGNTPIMMAISSQKDIVKLLLEYNPDLTIKNKKGQTVWDITEELFNNPVEAIYIGHGEMPELQPMDDVSLEHFLEVYQIIKIHYERELIKKEVSSTKSKIIKLL